MYIAEVNYMPKPRDFLRDNKCIGLNHPVVSPVNLRPCYATVTVCSLNPPEIVAIIKSADGVHLRLSTSSVLPGFPWVLLQSPGHIKQTTFLPICLQLITVNGNYKWVCKVFSGMGFFKVFWELYTETEIFHADHKKWSDWRSLRRIS